MPSKIASPAEGSLHETNVEMCSVDAACAIIGGDRPIHRSTLWRMIKAGQVRPPIKRLRRFVKSRLLEDVARLIAADQDTDAPAPRKRVKA
jgi:hypothetical protein